MVSKKLDSKNKKRNNRTGPRGPEYSAEYVRIARIAAENGVTNLQMARMFDCCKATFYNWMSDHPKFKAAILEGRDVFDTAVAETCLKKRIKGYKYTEVVMERSPMLPPDVLERLTDATAKEVYELLAKNLIVTKRTRKEVASDVTAIIFWLKNRNRERWPDKQAVAIDPVTVNTEVDPATQAILESIFGNVRPKTDQ